MTVSEKFIKLVEQFEGFRPSVYPDIVGKLTVGFGHRVLPCECFPRLLSRDDAEALLRQDVAKFEHVVNSLVTVKLKQEQFDALVSFTYNLGAGTLERSTLLTKLNAGHCCAVPDEIRRYCYAGGVKVAGLIVRRNAEASLYMGNS